MRPKGYYAILGSVSVIFCNSLQFMSIYEVTRKYLRWDTLAIVPGTKNASTFY